MSRRKCIGHASGGLTDVCVEVDGVLLLHESPGDDGLEE